MITDRDVEKFQILYQKENGDQISKAEALECVESMVDMLRHIYKPIKNNIPLDVQEK
jgi:hypothetical protein